ncbi:MAG: hypothetical protein LBD03_02590 [Methanobrevibacter sp.]|jgi:hypothetical protein|nr:hypothetical protein [Candidatus Methanovirga procula]
MFKKMFSLMIIAVLVISSVGAVAAADKFITVYSRTQENDGDGWIELKSSCNTKMTEFFIKPGETVRLNLTAIDYWFQGYGFDRLDFKSAGREACYSAHLHHIQNYKLCPVWKDVTDLTVNVNFYKKAAYRNKMMFPGGWYRKDDTYCQYPVFKPVKNADVDDVFAVIRA